MIYGIYFVALIVLQKIYEERGYTWGLVFCILFYGILGYADKSFITLYNDGMLQMCTELVIRLILMLIYTKIMYSLHNNTPGAITFVLIGAGVSFLIYYGMTIIYPILVDYALTIIFNFM